MKKTVLYSLLGLALGVHLLLGASIYLTYAEGSDNDDVYRNLELFTAVLERVRNDYVDGDDLTYQDLIYGALEGMLGRLDPHSEFLDIDRYEELKKDTEGMFGGVGLVITARDGVLTVVSPMDDSPAYRQGIRSGDEIIKIGGMRTANVPLPEAVKLLRGVPGTDVEVTVRRPSTEEEFERTLTRAVIKVETVKDIKGEREFPLGEDGVGYVRLTQFGERTTSELEKALKALSKQGMTSLVLDLRDNPGGLLDQAVEVCREFLSPDAADGRKQLVVSTEGRRPGDRSEYYVTRKGRYSDLPMVVLVNHGSASASEIVAGCLQDTSRAVIVGDKTFGKGSVQKILPLKGGKAALRLTTAKYYTPSRKVIHGEGITPDVIEPMTVTQEEALDVRMRGNFGDLPESEQEKYEDVEDVQLERAILVLKGIDLYSQRLDRKSLAPRRSTQVEPEPAIVADNAVDDL